MISDDGRAGGGGAVGNLWNGLVGYVGLPGAIIIVLVVCYVLCKDDDKKKNGGESIYNRSSGAVEMERV
eukprot:SAG31_NODE_25273_length_464_cov_1.342466_1_plen_69_part_00